MISVIIPTYKNKKILLNNLMHNLPHLKGCEIIVVNDNPEESLKKDLQFFHDRERVATKIVLMENKKNLGFGQTVNRAITKAAGKYVMLLNDDVRLVNNNYQSAINYFMKDNSLFAVSFAQMEKDGTIVGKNILMWKKGFVQHSQSNDLKKGDTAWAEGGACILRKDIFKSLSGFDGIYSPFYWEDIDLSYRAWKSGYSILFNPDILVEHEHETTIGTHFAKHLIRKIAYRNQLFFIWKNITDTNLFLEHVLRFPYNMVYFLLKDRQFVVGFFEALKRFDKVLSLRKNRKIKYQLTDREIFEKFYT